LNITKKWYSKISIIQQFFVVFAGKKHPIQIGKSQKVEKNQLRSSGIARGPSGLRALGEPSRSQLFLMKYLFLKSV